MTREIDAAKSFVSAFKNSGKNKALINSIRKLHTAAEEGLFSGVHDFVVEGMAAIREELVTLRKAELAARKAEAEGAGDAGDGEEVDAVVVDDDKVLDQISAALLNETLKDDSRM